MYHICVYLGQQWNHKLFHWCFIPARCRQPDLLCKLDMSSKASLVMDNLMGDIAPRPDPPGSLDFVCQYIYANFDGAGTILTMTDPPPIQFPSEKHRVSYSLTPNSLTDLHLFNLPWRYTMYHALQPPILPHGPPTTTSKTPTMTMMLLPF